MGIAALGLAAVPAVAAGTAQAATTSSAATVSPAVVSPSYFGWSKATGKWSNGHGSCTVQTEWESLGTPSVYVPYATKVSSDGELIQSSIHYEHVDGSSARLPVLHWTGARTRSFGPTRYSGTRWGNARTYVEAISYSSTAYCKVVNLADPERIRP